MSTETALDRLLKESDDENTQFSLEDGLEEEEEQTRSFLDSMSGSATDLLRTKIKSETGETEIVEEDESDEEEIIEEEDSTEETFAEEEPQKEEPKETFSHIEKVTLDSVAAEQSQPPQPEQPLSSQPEQPKKSNRGRKKMSQGQPVKKDQPSKATEFMNNLANECIDIMIQSGVTIHNFSDDQMNCIWEYIREKLNRA